MTQAEWLACKDPKPMLNFLQGKKASDRKLRLFAVGCAYKIRDKLLDPILISAIAVGERFADGNATREELQTLCRAAHQKRREFTTVYGIAAADCSNLIASQ